MNTLIEISKISYIKNNNIILNDINLKIKKTSFIVLIGPNGGGKSTLLKLILRLIKPTKGVIKKSKKLKIGYVPQEININKALPINVEQFISLGIHKNLFERIKNNQKIHKRSLNIIKKIGLNGLEATKVSALSGGQLQRAMIGRALLDKPDVLLLDEPTSNIDKDGVKQIFSILKKINKKKVGILMVNHDIHSTFSYANKVAHINKKLTLHKNNIKNLLGSNKEHFCEVEFAKILQKSHNQTCANNI